METIKDQAIVLKSMRFEERHRILTALTEHHGLISVIAKFSVQSRRFGAALETFSAGEWIYLKKESASLYVLKEAMIKEPFTELRQDFRRLCFASALGEILILSLPAHEVYPDLFKLHARALWILQKLPLPEEASKAWALFNSYLIKLLFLSGNQPRFFSCLSCEASLGSLSPQDELSGQVEEAGWKCPNCASVGALLFPSQPLLEIMLELASPLSSLVNHSQASLASHQQLYRFLKAYFCYHIPGLDRNPPKTFEILEQAF